MTKILILNNKICKLVDANEDIFKKLRRFLSFRQKGVEYTAAYKNGWDGVTYLLSKKGDFSLGLLEKTKEFLNDQSETFVVEDRRPALTSEIELDIAPRLRQMNKLPRDYQNEVVSTALANRMGIIRACTGAGKTVCTAILAAKINKPTNVYVVSLDLLQQFHDLFSEIFDEPIGFIGNGVCDIQRFNIVSVWTAARALGHKSIVPEEDNDFNQEDSTSNYPKITRCLKTARLHMFDECHTVVADSIRAIHNIIDPERIYGLSGTPFRDDGCDLLINSILGNQIIDVPASRLIEAGWLAQPLIKFVRVPKTYIHSSGTATYQTVYKEYIVENEIRNNLIIENTQQLLTKNYQVLVLFKHLQHGKILSEMFNERNIEHEYLSGAYSLEDRLAVKEKLLSNKAKLVLASSIFDIGIDISTLSGLVLAGSGKSSIKTLQRIGRIIRSYPGKKHAAVVDFYDDVRFLKAHSKIRHQIYQSENGFKLLIPSSLKNELM